MAFTRAERRNAFIKMAITGPSGSGKTFGALRLAFGLAGKSGKVAFADTENGSGQLYAHLGVYDVQDIDAPFTVQKYIAAIRDATEAGYSVLIIDSLSHAWAGEGGILDQKTARDARGGNSYTNWGEIGKFHEQLKNAILQSPIHIIACMRSKQDYVLEQGQNGKQSPRKVGLAPVQREGMEYEFTTVFDIDMTHTAAVSKDRTGLFTDEVAQITEKHGERIMEWANSGATPLPVVQSASPPPASQVAAAAADEAALAEHAAGRAAIADIIKKLATEDKRLLNDHMIKSYGSTNMKSYKLEDVEGLLAYAESIFIAAEADKAKIEAAQAPAQSPAAAPASAPAVNDDPFAD